MQILTDEKAQGSAELLLIFGGIIVVAIACAVIYRNYLIGIADTETATDLQNVIQGLDNLTSSLS